ncbi:MAG: hypothetical protein P4L10_10955 [Acidobacteriaceae bacterium]|nr:hypothetical protein [Acidobacteriaceae bacterium]
MSGALYESLYDLGYSISAGIVGKPYAQYRPYTSGAAISAPNLIGLIDAYLTTDAALKGASQLQYGKAVWYGALERNGIQPGDYIVGPLGTFFIAGTAYPGPVSLVQCNHNVTLTRLPANVTPGASSTYGGDVLAAETTIFTSWPCSLLIAGSRMTPSAMSLPNDGKMGTVQFLLPYSVPSVLYTNDILTDENGNRYAAASAEQTILGWRMNAEQWAV